MAKARTLTLNTKVNVTGADKLKGLGDRLSDVGKKLTVGVTLPIVGIGASMLIAAEDAAKAQAKLSNVFDSMGAAAFTSIDALNQHAAALQDATTFDDEAINELQSVLLTFGNVTGEAFTRATEAALDMSALLGQDLQSSAIQLGKALNDPIKGITALTRVGVSFTAQQKEQIRTLAESGDILGAQTVILDELERQFGGTAEALAGTAGGQMKQALNQLGEASEQFGAILAPMLVDIAKGLKEFAKWLQTLNPETKEWVLRIAAVAAAMGPVLFITGKLLSTFKVLRAGVLALRFAWLHIPTVMGFVDLAFAKTGRVARGLGGALKTLLGPLGLVLLAAEALNLGVGALNEAIGGPTGAFERLSHNFGKSADDVRNAVKGLADETGQSVSDVILKLDELTAAGHSWEEAIRLIARGADFSKLPETISRDLGRASGSLQKGAEDMADKIPTAMKKAQEEAEAIARSTPGALADQLRAGIEDYDKALEELTEVAVNSVSDLAERQKIEGILASKQLTDALNSDSTRTRLLAQDLVADLVSDYELLAPGALKAGSLVNPSLSGGLRSNLELTRSAAAAIVDAAGNPLVNLGNEAYGWGQTLGANFHAGMLSYIGAIRDASIRLGDAAASGIRLRSPAKEGALSEDASIWGRRLGQMFAAGMEKSLSVISAASVAMGGAAVPALGLRPGTVSSLSPMAGGAGGTTNIYLQWDGDPPKGRSESEIIGNLQRLLPLARGY